MPTEEKVALLTAFIEERDIFVKHKHLEKLIREYGMSPGQIARKTNLPPSYLSHLRRLKRIPDAVADGYYTSLISPSHIFILARLKKEPEIMQAYEEILSGNLTAVEAEALVREHLYKVDSKGDYMEVPEREKHSGQFAARYPTAELTLIQTRIKSKIIITIQGNLEKTGKILREILKKLEQ